MLELSFSKATGSVISLKNDEKEYLCADHDRFPLFKFNLLTPNRKLLKFSSLDAKEIEFLDGQGKTKIVFSGFNEAGRIHLTAEIIRISEDMQQFELSVNNATNSWVESITYPVLCFNNDLGVNGSRLFVPFTEGGEVTIKAIPRYRPDLRFRQRRLYPGIVSMQFMSWHTDSDGLYFAAHDTEGIPKYLDYYTPDECENAVSLHFEAFHAIAPHSFRKIGYPMVLKAHRGTWYGAAEIYREFLETSGFALPKKVFDDNSLPDWYKNSPILIIFEMRLAYDDKNGVNELYVPLTKSIQYLDRYAAIFNSRIMSLICNWEGSAPWAPPFNWPPYGGKDHFIDYIRLMHEHGHLVGLYGSGINWTDTTSLSPADDPFDRTEYRIENKIDNCFSCQYNGQYMETSCSTIRTGGHLCPACDITEKIVHEQITAPIVAGVDFYQFFDQDNGGFGAQCYSEKHPHPPVFGGWMPELLSKLFRKYNNFTLEHGSMLGTECSAADFFAHSLRMNDIRNIFQFYIYGDHLATPVPAYEFCLHEYLYNFMGNQSCYNFRIPAKVNPDSFFLRLAYGLVNGDLLSLPMFNRKGTGLLMSDSGDSLGKEEELFECVRNYNAFRKGTANQFLQYGRMLAPDKVTVEGPPYVLYLSKNSNFEKYGVMTAGELSGETMIFASVQAAKWQAPDRSRAMIFANFNREPKKINVESTITNIATHQADLAFKIKDGIVEFMIPPFTAACAKLN